MSRIDPRYVRKPRKPLDKLTTGLLIAFGVVAIITAVVAFIVVRNLVASWTMTPLPGAPVASGGTGTNPKPNDVSATLPPNTVLQPAGGPTPKPWDGTSRVNVLVMGLDYRDWEAGEKPRTDSMLLFTLDPVTKTAGILSIPRDLWVAIPGFDYAKINTAFYLGEVYNLPGGGPALAVQTVEQVLGVPINFYAQIDFAAFTRFVDLLDGVRVTPQQDMKIAAVGSTHDVYLKAGETVTLDGPLALAYARNRYTAGDDFDRSRRQQEVILGIRDRILDFNMMPNLLAKSAKIYNELASGIHTNMAVDQAIQLALLAESIPKSSIKQVVIGPDQVIIAKSPDGLDILKPIPDQIRILRDQVFASGAAVAPEIVTKDKAALAKTENARISIQNGAGEPGLAARTSDFLKSKGLTITEEINSEAASETKLIIYNSTPYTLAYLAELMNVDSSRIFNKYDPNSQIDIAVILGSDWAANNPMP